MTVIVVSQLLRSMGVIVRLQVMVGVVVIMVVGAIRVVFVRMAVLMAMGMGVAVGVFMRMGRSIGMGVFVPMYMRMDMLVVVLVFVVAHAVLPCPAPVPGGGGISLSRLGQTPEGRLETGQVLLRLEIDVEGLLPQVIGHARDADIVCSLAQGFAQILDLADGMRGRDADAMV